TRLRLWLCVGNPRLELSRAWPSAPSGTEKPIPGSRLHLQILKTGKLLPGQVNARQANFLEANPAKPVTHLKRLPEVLFQSLRTILTEGKVVTGVLVEVSGALTRRF